MSLPHYVEIVAGGTYYCVACRATNLSWQETAYPCPGAKPCVTAPPTDSPIGSSADDALPNDSLITIGIDFLDPGICAVAVMQTTNGVATLLLEKKIRVGASRSLIMSFSTKSILPMQSGNDDG